MRVDLSLRGEVKSVPAFAGTTMCVLTAHRGTGSHAAMVQHVVVTLALALLASPASAIVGGGGAPGEAMARAVVTIIGSRGTFCSGTLIARHIVLTAAHCVLPGADYKVILPGETPPRFNDVSRIASHPEFNVQAILAHRASADVALLQLKVPLPAGKTPAPLGPPLPPVQPG